MSKNLLHSHDIVVITIGEIGLVFVHQKEFPIQYQQQYSFTI